MRGGLSRILATLLLALGAAVASAQDAAEPFADPSGFVTRSLKYSDVVQALGEPTVSEVRGRNKRTGPDDGVHRFAYPERGLAFTIAAEDRPLADPPIASMNVERTPQGLQRGQRETEARAIVDTHYRLLLEQGTKARRTLLLTDRDDRTRRVLRVDLRDGSVAALEFMLGERPSDDELVPKKPWLSRRTRSLLVELLAIAIVGAVAGGIAFVWRRLRRSGVVTQAGADRLRRGSALLLALGGAAGLVIGVAMFREGGWGALVGMVFAGGGLFALVAGAALWIGPWRRH